MKEMFLPLRISASALEAQKVRINTIASNIANVNSTKTPEGGPYKRKDVLFQSHLYNEYSSGVNVTGVVEDNRQPRTVYDPSHPDADKSGYVQYPNINSTEEMVNLISASRAFEANLTLINSYKEMYMKVLDLAKA